MTLGKGGGGGGADSHGIALNKTLIDIKKMAMIFQL